MNQTQINYIKAELESISSDEELFPGFFPELSADQKLKQSQDKAKKLLEWIESGMQIADDDYQGESVEDNIFRS